VGANVSTEMNDDLIYMDHAATTPVAPAVLEAMLPYFGEYYGNPSSMHRAGRRASVALEGARRTIAQLIAARPSEIIFTGCGSESDNAALRGIALARRATTGANRILTTPIEHHAVLHTAEDLCDRYGFELTLIPVDQEGLVDPAVLTTIVGDGRAIALVSIMYANNEVGTVQPIAEIGALCRAAGVPFHSDAVQAAGKLPLDVQTLQIDALSVGAHKFYGPKGVGFLYLRSGTPFWPILTGGAHEGGRRAGTENVPLIVGMAKALELAVAERATVMARLSGLRDGLIGSLLETIDGVQLTGARRARLPNHASFIVDGVDAESALIALDLAHIAASSGSACSSGSQRPSHVLAALGCAPTAAACALRFSLGHSNTGEQVNYVVEKMAEIVRKVRG
jgi:cysteine desulfurase